MLRLRNLSASIKHLRFRKVSPQENMDSCGMIPTLSSGLDVKEFRKENYPWRQKRKGYNARRYAEVTPGLSWWLRQW